MFFFWCFSRLACSPQVNRPVEKIPSMPLYVAGLRLCCSQCERTVRPAENSKRKRQWRVIRVLLETTLQENNQTLAVTPDHLKTSTLYCNWSGEWRWLKMRLKSTAVLLFAPNNATVLSVRRRPVQFCFFVVFFWSELPVEVSVSVSEGCGASSFGSTFSSFDVNLFLRILKSLKTKHVFNVVVSEHSWWSKTESCFLILLFYKFDSTLIHTLLPFFSYCAALHSPCHDDTTLAVQNAL